MNYALEVKKEEHVFKYDFSFEELNKFILDKIMDNGKVCSYYIADIIYNGNELAEPFYIDTYNMQVCWLNDWYEGGTIYNIFGFIDSVTIKDFTLKYLWRNRYRGGFEHESNHN